MEQFICKNKWVVLVSGAVIQIFAGIPAAWGVFQKSVESTYKLDTNAVSMVFSFTIAAFGIGCVIGGALQDKASPRIACILGGVLLAGGFIGTAFVKEGSAVLLYLIFSVNVGLGCAFLYPAVMSCVQKWYADKKGLATGIVGGAVGLSGIMLTTVGRFLIDKMGIRGCFTTLGIALFILSCMGAILMVNPSQNTCSSKKQIKSYSPIQMLKTPQYYIVFAAVCFSTPAVLLFSPTIIQYGIDRGLPEGIAVLSIAIGSVFSAGGRVLCPLLSDKIGRRWTNIILFASLAVFSVIFIFSKGIWVIALYSLLTFCYSGEAAVIPAISTDLYGFKHSGINYGLLALGTSVGSVGFPILVNAISQTDTTRHIIAISAAIAGIIIIWFLKPTQGEKI